MNLEEAQAVAEKFLEQLTLGDDYFHDPDTARLWVQYVAPNLARDGLDICFSIDESESPPGPELQKLASDTIDALKKAHPELPELTWEIG